jgi:pimeloyl-ACP methyl ester carboxylesterase
MARRPSVSRIADASFPQRHHHPSAIRPKNATFAQLGKFASDGMGYSSIQGTRPQILGGGHFAALEQPELFVAELRKSFAQVR